MSDSWSSVWKDMRIVVVLFVLWALFAVLDLSLPRSPALPPESANMREMFNWITMYKNNHNQSLPGQSGQKFLLEIWRSGVIERDHKNARRFFSVAEPYPKYLATLGIAVDHDTAAEYLSDWQAIEPGYINYAGFDPQGQEHLWEQLRSRPESVTIMANATFAHRNSICYMTGDGEVHELSLSQLLDKGVLTEKDLEVGEVPVGKSSPIEALRTVTND